jgi:DNA recombination protein RmuC
MKALGAGVGDLKRVLSGVKTRGVMGEVLLGSLLEQVLTPEQYERNACVREGSAERVDYAIKLPGQDGSRSHIYVPIDSKFPMEDYQRLQDAYELADVPQIEQQLKQLEVRIKTEAKSIYSKYVNPPNTTDFAILFLPNEGLFAEVIRRPGLQEYLMRECKIIVCGPTYLHGLLNSLSMGFRTLAIEKKSTEVWNTLGVVKTQFGAFADLLESVKSKLIQTTTKIDQAATKARTIERKLKNVEALPAPAADIADEFGARALAALPEPETEDQEAA